MKPERAINKLKNGEALRIVAFGDSLTQGWMVRKGYVDFLNEMLLEKYPKGRFEIINKGMPGDTADYGLYRLRSDVLDLEPDLVFIQFALNDLYCGITPGKFKNNIASMTNRINNDTFAEILLITSVYLDNESENRGAEEFYLKLKEISESENLAIANVHEYWKEKVNGGIDFNTLVQGDRVHPTVEGYKLMAEAIMKKF